MNIPKFRSWFKEQKCMVDVDGIDFVNSIFSYREDIYQYDAELSEVILMQSTGLTDKNEKLIFEGDIINIGDPKITYVVEWADTSLRGRQLHTTGSFIGIKHWMSRIEILGNIHANKELLNDN